MIVLYTAVVLNLILWCVARQNIILKIILKPESIPLGCVPPTRKLYMLQVQWPPPDAPPGGPLIDKFEQVSSEHQMLLAGWSPGLMYVGRGSVGLMVGGLSYLTFPGGVPYHVTYPMMHLMLPPQYRRYS